MMAWMSKESIKELFGEISTKVGERPGGYTRILKTGNRLGDNAEMCMIELVDFNEIYTNEKKAAAKKSTRRRSTKKSDATTEAPVAEAKVEDEAPVSEEAPKAEKKDAKKDDADKSE